MDGYINVEKRKGRTETASSKNLNNKKWKPSYEEKRKSGPNRELIGKWLGKYKWLREQSAENVLYCDWCSKSGRSNVFAKGCSVFKSDALSKHEKCADHKFSSIAHLSEAPKKNWEKAVANGNERAATAVKGIMNIVYSQAKENLATCKIKTLKKLCKDLGADFLKDVEVDKHTNYESYDAVHEMEEAIANVIKEKIIARIKNSRWYSVCFDESTDVSVTQSVIVYVKVVFKGELFTYFLQLESLEGTTATDIYNAALRVLNSFNISVSKLSSVSTDGCSVMTGIRNGVTTKFMECNSYIIPIHCVAHRLALASGQAADQVPYLLKFQEIVNKVFKYFEYSAKRTRSLREVQNVLDQAEKKFVQIFHTRWLSFHNSLDALSRNWSSLVALLLQDNSAVGQGLLKSVTNYKFLICVAFLSDTLYVLNQLCLVFQKENMNMNTVLSQVDACINHLKNLKAKRTGTQYMSFKDKVPKQACPDGFDYEGHHVRDSEAMRRQAECVMDMFMGYVIENVEERLGNVGQLGIFTFMLPSNIPGVTKSNFSEYGNEAIPKICVHFKDHAELCDHVGVSAEWNLLKRILSVRCKNMTLKEVVKFLHDNEMSSLYPLMVSLFEYMLSLPMSTVDCERGFSVMNLTKTSLRNRMSVPHLSTLMMISINGEDRQNYDFDKAFLSWCSKREHRAITHKHKCFSLDED